MSRNNLGELEQVVLLAVLRLDEAYGSSLRAEIRSRTGRSITAGAIYPTLDRLEQRGLVTSGMSEPQSCRGGRAKRVFRVTPSGLAEIRRACAQTFALAEGLELVRSPKSR